MWGTVTAVITDTTLSSMLRRIPFADLIPPATDFGAGVVRAAEILGIEPNEETNLIAFRINFDDPHAILPEIPLVRQYRELVLHGEKTTTVRRKHQDLMPGPALLCFGPNDYLRIAITAVTYTVASALSDTDARRDGFSSRNQLLTALNRHYPSFQENEPVTIVEFKNGMDYRPRSSTH